MKSISTIFTLVLIFAFTSSSIGQTNWTKYPENPVFDRGLPGEDDDLFVTMPSVRFDSFTYKMWYSYGNADRTLEHFGYATSDDGINWIKDTLNNPVLEHGPTGSWDEYGISVPFVLHLDTLYHMWYKGYSTSSLAGHGALGHATSPDGINWTKDSHNPVLDVGGSGEWDDVWLGCPSVLFDGSTYHMWYNAWNGDFPDVVRIGHSTALHPDSTWTKDQNNPVLDRGSFNSWDYPRADEPNVIFDGTIFHMWYLGGELFPSCVGYAWSTDGSNWTKYKNNPVLNVGAAGTWDDYGIGFFSLLLDTVGHELKMWSTGFDGYWSWNHKIGYATAPAIINVPNQYTTIQSAIDAAHDGNVILVDEGTYYENINFKGKAITVASQFYMDNDTSHISKTIIDGSQPTNPDSGSVVFFVSGEDTTSVLCGFTITGGSGTYNEEFDAYGGGGILMYAGGKVLHNKITGNHLVSQKGIYGAGLICVISNDSANIVIANNDFKYNSIVSPKMSGGGGLYLYQHSNDGYCRVNNNLISYNSTTCTRTYKAIGGGLGVSINLPTAGNIIIESNMISHNELHCTASIGGGIYVVYWDPGYTIVDENPTPLIYNNIIKSNYCEGKGGGIGIWTVEYGHQSGSVISPQPEIINNTIVNNSAEDGCGLFSFDSYPLLLNNIMWDDLSASGSNEIFNSNINYPPYCPPYHDPINNGNIFAFYSDIQGGWEGEGNTNAEPLFVDAENSDFSLIENSPGIGWGVETVTINEINYICPSVDYSGNTRPDPIDEFVDMGAIESPFKQTPPTAIDDNNTLPIEFALKQNYPNPFNPSIDLKVYNILGKEVTTLVSNKLNQGKHTYQFDGKNLASGIYYYQLVAGDFREVKKMILLR
jgi:predicted GH43/DUF377 family glycosyl hydrolase